MVNEREPARTPSSKHHAHPRPAERQPLATVSSQVQMQPQQPLRDPAGKPILQPEFGKASPLRNPLKNDNYSHMFNVPKSNQPRPELHLPPPPQPLPRSSFYLAGAPLPATNPANPPYQPVYPTSVPVSVPKNPYVQTTLPPPKPSFSSLGPGTYLGYSGPPTKNVIDLTTEHTEFDPDAALRDDRFGAPDPYNYVDAAQASENIKALLEGAFDDDDDDKPKTRLRKRAKKQETEAKSLAEKLEKLNVKTEDDKDAKEEEEDDEEDGTVDGMTIKLLPHQVEGVAWMLDKEIGERKKNGVLPKGGILADDMGLGKTVQSVALILTNPRPPLNAKPEKPKQKLPSTDVGKGTLVVAPLALIKQWESEIKTKVEKDHALRVLVHHGPSRTKSAYELKKYDVVITTYQILASEHASSSDDPSGPQIGCFGVHWYRVMLDEAHSIKNRNAKSTQACYALRSWYRWCLTGTPMQNNLDELQSLIRFLDIKPYNEFRQWKEQITGPMKNGRGGLAMKRLQYFLKAFMKRRTKDILKKEGALNFGGAAKPKEGQLRGESMQIVERKVEVVTCQFDAGERAFYDRLQDRAQSRLEEMMGDARTDYIGALVLLLRLRQACNHPQLIEAAMNKDKDALTTGQAGGVGGQTPRKAKAEAAADVDDIANMLGGLSVQTNNCDVCQVGLSAAEAKSGAVRCADCEADLAAQRGMKEHRHRDRGKRDRPGRKSERGSGSRAETAKPRVQRNRKVVTDSDDEEGEGEWLVPASKQDVSDLGIAGGTDDEDADGGGETLGSTDSETDDESNMSGLRHMSTKKTKKKKSS
ncbi:hypothetical protein LTR28_008421, partial [Elasticomyces elasticus]